MANVKVMAKDLVRTAPPAPNFTACSHLQGVQLKLEVRTNRAVQL